MNWRRVKGSTDFTKERLYGIPIYTPNGAFSHWLYVYGNRSSHSDDMFDIYGDDVGFSYHAVTHYMDIDPPKEPE